MLRLNSADAILDGWSNPILLGFVHDLYLQLLLQKNKARVFKQLLGRIESENSYGRSQLYLQSQSKIADEYWQQQLAKVDDYVDLKGLLRVEQQDVDLYDYRLIKDRLERRIYFTDGVYSKIQVLSHNYGITINAILQYGWHKLLQVYGHSKSTVVGTTVAGRNIPIDGIDDSVGLYINTLPLIMVDASQITILEAIQALQKDIQDLNHYSNISLAKLQSNGTRIFNNLFVYESYPVPEVDASSPIKFKMIKAVEELDYPLGVTAYEAEGAIVFNLKYAGELFSEGVIDNLLATYSILINDIVSNGNIATRSQDSHVYLTEEMYTQIIRTWNETDKVYPDNKTIHQLFEEQVARTPDNIAVVYEDTHLSYTELNNLANQLAHYIKDKYNIKDDDLIALCLDRSEYMIIAILAVLKAGGAYVPLDPTYPDDRVSYILQDTKAKILLIDQIYHSRLQDIIDTNSYATCIEVINNRELRTTTISKQPTTNLRSTITSNNLAYVIYTSGTTGNPKGVLIQHNSVVNYVYNLISLTINAQNIDFSSNLAFDLSVTTTIYPICCGKIINIYSDDLSKIEKYIEYLSKNNIEFIKSTPSFLSLINGYVTNKIKYCMVGGEKLTFNNAQNILKYSVCLFDEYGPTEATVGACTYQITLDTKNINIGRPYNNTKLYILNTALLSVPIGAIGELYIGGAGIASGYLNLPELTAQQFIANPFQSSAESKNNKNAILYKTGDLVRYLPDGNIEYMGRNDFQVKIRGYRIELGEIERALMGYAGIKQAVVIDRERHVIEGDASATKYLVAYYVAEAELDNNLIMSYLQDKLPEYMVPSVLVYLDKLPLTINGKLDRQALPDFKFTSSDTYVAPRNELEEQVCAIYASVLGLDVTKVGIRDDFFRLGGDSIVSIQLVSKIRQSLKLNISVKDIFSCRTVEHLYDQVLCNINSRKELLSETGELLGAVELLPIQKWFVSKVSSGEFRRPHHWNQSFLIKVDQLNIDVLEQSVIKLLEYHDALRLQYKVSKMDYQQFYAPYTAYTLHQLDISNLNMPEGNAEFNNKLSEILTTWQSDFNLCVSRPLYRFGYITGYKDGSSRIFVACHHLVIDAVSWRIIADDLRRIYSKLLTAEDKTDIATNLDFKAEAILGVKGTSYRQWVACVSQYKDNYPQEINYWHNQLLDLEAATNTLRKLGVASKPSIINFALDKKTTQKLLTQSNKAYNTQINDLLLTALGLALQQITQSNINHIILEGHGREDINTGIDITHTVGWFTIMYPVRLEVVADDMQASIITIKETLRQIPNHGIGYGAILAYVTDKMPLVSFNYLGQFNKITGNEWEICSDDSGRSIASDNTDKLLININALVIDGKFQVNLASRLNLGIVEQLALEFENQLRTMIGQLSKQQQLIPTMSDFSDYESYIVVDNLNNRDLNSNNNLFLFPPALGGYESHLETLVPKIKNRKMILFNNFYLYLERSNYVYDIDYGLLADLYIAHMKQLQPLGPYNLFGWSFGGVFAFEISRKLFLRGDVINNLYMIDPIFNEQIYADKKNFLKDGKININYSPDMSKVDLMKTNITLFKAQHDVSVDEKDSELFNDYVHNVPYNNLDQIIDKSLFQVIKLSASHFSFIKHTSSINKIVKVINSEIPRI